MDATNPRRRWAHRLAILTLLCAGCTGDRSCRLCETLSGKTCSGRPGSSATAEEKKEPAKARGQAPSEPVPGYPVGPVGPAPSPSPIIAPTPPALPTPVESKATPRGEVLPTPGTGDATPAAFVMPPNAAAMKQFILNSKPQVKVVAIVGKGNIVTDEEVWQMVRQRPDHRDALTSSDRETRELEMYRYELKKIIERELLVDDMFAKMKKNKPGAIEEIREYASKTADRNLRDYRRRYGFATEKELEEKALVPQGLTVNVLRRQIERNTVAMEYIRSMVREQAKGIGLGDVHEYYVKNPDKFQTPERVKWQDLFIAFGKFATPEEAYRHAEEIRRQAVAGADFAALSKQHDHGDAGFRNGDGVGTTRGEIRPSELEPAVFQTPPGQVSTLIQGATGYHIIKATEHAQAGIRPLDEKCQSDIREMLFEQMRKQVEGRLTENLWRKGAVQIVDVP